MRLAALAGLTTALIAQPVWADGLSWRQTETAGRPAKAELVGRQGLLFSAECQNGGLTMTYYPRKSDLPIGQPDNTGIALVLYANPDGTSQNEWLQVNAQMQTFAMRGHLRLEPYMVRALEEAKSIAVFSSVGPTKAVLADNRSPLPEIARACLRR